MLPSGAAKVDLLDKGLGDDGIARLAKELAENTTVTELILSHNQVGAAGAASLASALEKNATLWELDLRDNEVGADAFQRIWRRSTQSPEMSPNSTYRSSSSGKCY